MFSKVSFRQGILLLLSALTAGPLAAQIVRHERLLSFEEKTVPTFLSAENSEISVSGTHYKDGTQSLCWSFRPGGTLTLRRDVGFEPRIRGDRDLYLSTFVVWVYNERPVNDSVRFEFLRDGRRCAWFSMWTGFKGWRAAWVCFERDMRGTPEKGMDEIRIVAPGTSGRLWIDHLIPAVKTDPRHQTADLQVPFVNAACDNHWLVVLKRSRMRPDLPLEETVTPRQKEQIAEIERRFRRVILNPGKPSDKTVNTLRAAYEKYGIRYDSRGRVSGLPIFFGRAQEAYERLIPDWKRIMERNGMEVRAYFDLMNRIAVAYNNAVKEEHRKQLREMFLAMYDHITDQGVAYGSCWGNFTHYGYSFRGFYTSYFLMKEVLRSTGRLDDASRAMLWYATTNEVYPAPTMAGMDMDSFNTVTTGRIASILLMEDSPEKVRYLRSFSRWIDNGCQPAPGLAGAFKTDGGAFHHRNNYPAYAVGGLEGATNMIYLLHGTDFAVSESGHSTVKHVLLTMRFYCNTRYFPLSMSGRHPNGKGKLSPLQYATMALAGTPDGRQEYDPEMAAAFLRLVAPGESRDNPEYMPYVPKGREKRMQQLLLGKGFRPEKDPQGNIAMGYGCVSVQRRDNWSAVARGHSRYLWASEHYAADNFYGRYLAHGSLQILTAAPGAEVTPATSGWQEEGFDWGRIPGTTAIHLPVERLRARIYNVDAYSGNEEMLLSDETFAGGISQEGRNGAFGMKLHEHDKYNGSHRARKSFHFFDGRIVCLGSDIENTNGEYDTETTVFQLTAPDSAARAYWQTYRPEGGAWLDHLGTGYFIPDKPGNRLKFDRRFPQLSLGEKTGKETRGDWVSLTIDHGKAPQGASYEYAILPRTSSEALQAFARKPAYEVLQHDRRAHIVRDLPTRTTSYVLFETAGTLPGGIVRSVDTASLVMLREISGKEAVLTVCNPDLALYRGPADEKYDKEGKRIERSVYSRSWIDNPSGTIPVRVTLEGEWNAAGSPECRVVSSDGKTTVLEFSCHDGASFEVRLERKR